MNQQKGFGCLSAILLVALCASMLFNVLSLAKWGSSVSVRSARTIPKFEEQTAQASPAGESSSEDKIALISLRGIITSAEPGTIGETMVDDMKLQLSQAVADSKVKAIVLHVDSPGGEVTASDIIYEAVKAAREKKPVVVHMGSLAASGGYYVACGGSKILANETTLTGSIGVIMQSLKYRGLMDKVGVDVVTFKSGKFKDMLSGSRDLTDEERAYIDGMVQQTYDKFVGIVARERKLDEKMLREGVADGRVVSGKDALAQKLIDGYGSIEDAYANARELGKAKGAAVVRYEAPFKLGRLFRMLGESEGTGGKLQINVTEALAPKLQPGRLYYLPSFMAP